MKELLTSIENINQPIRFAYFDLGGVVFKFSGGLETISSRLGIPLASIESYWRAQDDQICLGKLTPQDFWVNLVSHFGRGEKDMNFLEMWIDHFEAISETHGAMEELQSNGVQIGLLTNIYPSVLEKAIEKGYIPQLPYHSVIQSCEVGLVKPDKQIFELALKPINYLPSEVILIDDREENIEVARTLGWNVHHFK